MEVVKLAKNSPKFICEICDYKCFKKNDMKKHTATVKHAINAGGSIGSILEVKKIAKKYHCLCGKKYGTHGGLWKHKQKCDYKINTNVINVDDDDDDDNDNDNDDDVDENKNTVYLTTPSENVILAKHGQDITQLTNLVIEVVRNNSELQKQMMDMCKNMQTTMISNCNNNNINNNTTNHFNLQLFLNEYCKDAMNISEFIDSFQLQISDLENVGRVGYIEGISNIIINKIKDLDVNMRPIHCSDLKREVIYIKDDDVWEREDANNTKFRKVIYKVSRKSMGMLTDWRELYPDYEDIESEYNTIYLKLIKAALGPTDTIDNENKIIKKITKHIVIDRGLCPALTHVC